MALILEKSKSAHEVMLRLVYEALMRHGGNKTKAANDLGVTARCVRMWVAKYDQLIEFRKAGG